MASLLAFLALAVTLALALASLLLARRSARGPSGDTPAQPVAKHAGQSGQRA